MLKFIAITVAMVASVAAAPGLAGLGHGPIIGSPLALSAPISYGAPIAKIAAPISLGAPALPLDGHLGLGYGGGLYGSPYGKIAAPSLGYGLHGLGLGLGGHGLGAPIW